MFDPQHLQGVSNELVQSMFKIGRKAAELERSKLQTEIQKERNELRRKQLEKRVAMAGKNPGKADGKGGPVKNPRKDKEEEEFLDDLVLEPKLKRKTPSVYLSLELGGFVTKGADHKDRLDQHHKRIVAAASKAGDDDDNEKQKKNS